MSYSVQIAHSSHGNDICSKEQGCKFSDFTLILDFFTSTTQKIVVKISSLEHGFMIESDLQKKSL